MMSYPPEPEPTFETQEARHGAHLGPPTVVGLEEPEPAIHLPGPSLWPVTLALGITLIVSGPLVVQSAFSIAGALLSAYAIARWVVELRREEVHESDVHE
jgi:hypothetical protein